MGQLALSKVDEVLVNRGASLEISYKVLGRCRPSGHFVYGTLTMTECYYFSQRSEWFSWSAKNNLTLPPCCVLVRRDDFPPSFVISLSWHTNVKKAALSTPKSLTSAQQTFHSALCAAANRGDGFVHDKPTRPTHVFKKSVFHRSESYQSLNSFA
jgi:hypothetical protein